MNDIHAPCHVTPVAAIRLFCTRFCHPGGRKSVRECLMSLCPLFEYRMGINPARRGIGGGKHASLLAGLPPTESMRTLVEPLRAHDLRIKETGHCEYCGHGGVECMKRCGHLICSRKRGHAGDCLCCFDGHHPLIIQAYRKKGYGPAARLWYADAGRCPDYLLERLQEHVWKESDTYLQLKSA